MSLLETTFDLRFNHNQTREIKRLLDEIIYRENISESELIADLKKKLGDKKLTAKDKIEAVKKYLICRRFPLTSQNQTIDCSSVYLPGLNPPLENNWQASSNFKPLEIFVEKDVENSYLVKNFSHKFPETKITIVDCYSNFLKTYKFNPADLKKPLVFIVKERWDFLKPCPCTKNHLGCGYWILNLGFGCPFDCSYCFLQGYANFPGMIMPGNLDDFFTEFDQFYKKLSQPIRIGTGEFCDSLALDHISQYSIKLIEYFRDKKVIFELKTKSINIDNILSLTPAKNIVISWSLNTSQFSQTEELATPSLDQRLQAACALQKKGWKIGFHFDPIIYYSDWEESYKKVVEKIYQLINPDLAWISLGTLRCHRQLKNVSQQRFPKSSIFYGELLMGDDKKLRYPEFLRAKIYQNMVKWIRQHDQHTPVYLCMESQKMWKIIGEQFSNSKTIENYLIEKMV